jgi:hypothetical protein
MDQDKAFYNKRKNPRVDRKFSLKYRLKGIDSQKFDISQIKDISQGGVRFFTSFFFKENSVLIVELHVPYVDQMPIFEGQVVGCQEKIPLSMYETRLKFINVTAQAREVLQLIEKKFAKGA